MLVSTENQGINNPKLFEGDMKLTPEQRKKAEMEIDVDSTLKRGSMRTHLWPNGVVIYEIESTLGMLSI